jgi:hypothetical protein
MSRTDHATAGCLSNGNKRLVYLVVENSVRNIGVRRKSPQIFFGEPGFVHVLHRPAVLFQMAVDPPEYRHTRIGRVAMRAHRTVRHVFPKMVLLVVHPVDFLQPLRMLRFAVIGKPRSKTSPPHLRTSLWRQSVRHPRLCG